MVKLTLPLFTLGLFYISNAQDWPCPPAAQILPCFCSSDAEYNLRMDCNAVESDEELRAVFEDSFPFYNFALFTLIKTPGGENLNSLINGTFGLVTFEEFEIIGTSLKTIESDVFSMSNLDLKRLVLRNNAVFSFSLNYLEPFIFLDNVDISENQATAVSDVHSDSVTILLIGNNQLNQLSLSFLTFAQDLVVLKAENNNIIGVQSGTFTGLPSIDEIDLSDNNIQRLVTGAMNLDTNSLTKLYLSNNLIATVEENFINQINPSVSINLRNNSISSIDEVVWSPILNMIDTNNLQAVDFSDNPILCDCDILWLVSDDTLLNKISIDTRCSSGEFLYQVDVDDLTSMCS